MKRTTLLVIGIIVIASVILCSKRVAADETASPTASSSPLTENAVVWSQKMQSLYKTLVALFYRRLERPSIQRPKKQNPDSTRGRGTGSASTT